jgi:hypothetical protein
MGAVLKIKQVLPDKTGRNLKLIKKAVQEAIRERPF